MNTGKKYDNEKPRMDLVPPFVDAEVAHVWTHGAAKYGDHNWKLVIEAPNGQRRYMAAAQRHIDAYMDGGILDQESWRHHLAHAICCLQGVLWSDLSVMRGCSIKQRVYIIGPYTSGGRGSMEANRDAALNHAQIVSALGFWPVVPHNMSNGIEALYDSAEWLEYTMAELVRCDAFSCVPGWETSDGSKAEVGLARSRNMREITVD
jgi:hypothetical protein